MKRAFFLAGLALMVAGCGGGGSDDASSAERGRPAADPTDPPDYLKRALNPVGIMEADGTIAYCEDYAQPSQGPYRYENNVWGKELVGEEDYDQCVLERTVGVSTEYGWRWDWPLGEGMVKAFPEVIYGFKPWWSLPSTTPLLPIRVVDVREFTVRYDVDMTAAGFYNLAFDWWLTDTGTPAIDSWLDTKTIRYEIMVWLDRSEQWTRTPCSEPWCGVEAMVDGRSFYLFREDDFVALPDDDRAIWTIIVFMPTQASVGGTDKRFTGVLDVVAFLDYLVDEGHIAPDLYIADIELGNEVIEGTGEVWLRDYEVTVR